MYSCVIFDLDGTLLNTLDDLAAACNHALSVQGLPVHETEKFRYFVGNGIPKLIERILPEDKKAELHEKTYRLFCDYYDLHKNNANADKHHNIEFTCANQRLSPYFI